MANCLKASYAGGNGFPIVFFDAAGNDIQQPYTRIKPLSVDSSGDTAACPYLLLSSSEYQALLNRVSALESRPLGSGASSGGGNDVNVSADIFIGALLVLCFALGWIAGGQR